MRAALAMHGIRPEVEPVTSRLWIRRLTSLRRTAAAPLVARVTF